MDAKRISMLRFLTLALLCLDHVGVWGLVDDACLLQMQVLSTDDPAPCSQTAPPGAKLTLNFFSAITAELIHEPTATGVVNDDTNMTHMTPGVLSVNVHPGQHSYSVTVAGYTSFQGTIHVDDAGIEHNIFLSPTLEPADWRIVLTWGNGPRQLDSQLHFQKPDIATSERQETAHRLDISNTDITATNGVTAHFERNYVHDQGGPETMTLNNVNECSDGECRWYYAVRHYDCAAEDMCTSDELTDSWAQSNALVTVYHGDEVHSTFSPTDDDGKVVGHFEENLWLVFSIDNGVVDQCVEKADFTQPGHWHCSDECGLETCTRR